MQNRFRSKKIFPYYLVTLFSLTLAFSNSSYGDEALEYQKNLEKWSQRLPELEESGTGKTAKEIALIRSWIGQAQAFVANEKFEKIDPILARIEAMVDFVRVRQDRVKIENAVEEAEEKLAELNQSIAQTKAEADAMLEQIKKYEDAK